MNASRLLLQHFLAAIAYRTQKALRDAPAHFADFRAGTHVRTPRELVWHMTGVIGYARTMLHGGDFAPPPLPSLAAEVTRFHETLAALRDDFGNPQLVARISDEQFLHGPLADTMTHAGQLALLRRLAGAPVPSENFIFAEIAVANVGEDQPAPAAPDAWWRPDQPPLPPAPDPLQAQRDSADGFTPPANSRPTLFEALGGMDGVLHLAHAWHERCLADTIVAHAFSHGYHPEHTERLAAYWAEAWGGPSDYSARFGTESSVVRMHSGNGDHHDMDARAIDCFALALDDIGTTDAELRHTLLDYFTWTTTTTMAAYPRSRRDVPEGLRLPRWTWTGLEE